MINFPVHLINFRFIPDSFDFKVLLENLRGFAVQITESLIRILRLPIAVVGSSSGVNLPRRWRSNQ